ncbi:hypothetical protein CHU93_00295 [Sandarakinorhabdus cyanobacteriorum]|uniref:NIPSNAP domain-containing protein n=1 Tax=Sandarakinorhabdus cyanobacteriorum TaxID=1981098 RepID=A0A255ZAF5_9SPHN|nr:hypothetical protein [Sandarakinorhabdus cyanobacteriorum]OYQ37874.1 hypothetical protein CHU93_00295 [Sandarakinorhabdus cyanobacteriorum]
MTATVLRLTLWVFGMTLAGSISASAIAGAAAAEPATTRVVTLTYLKSAPGRLAQLERFVRANWFAMDAIAVRQGLFLDYRWFDTGSEDGAWNAIVMVTYRDEKGFEGVAPRWAPIQSAHRTVLPDGFAFAQLGRVVENRNLIEHGPFPSRLAVSAQEDQP